MRTFQEMGIAKRIKIICDNKTCKITLVFMYSSGQRLKTSDLNFNPCLRSSAREQDILENVAPKFTSEMDKQKYACGSKVLGEQSVVEHLAGDVCQK